MSPQPVRDNADVVLGGVRPDRLGLFRVGRYQDLHALLGHADVRHLRSYQCDRAVEPAHRHDEPLLPTDIRQYYHFTYLRRYLDNICITYSH